MSGALKIRTSTGPDVWTTIGGGSFASEAETVAGVLDDRAVTPAGLNAALDEAIPAAMPYINVREYGAVGDGTTDDTAAIQAAIDYCLGGTPAAGVSSTRIARAALYLPKGIYKTTAALRIISAMGFEMYGDGPQATNILCSGVRTYGIEFNGLAHSHIHDFGIGVTDVSSTCQTMIAVEGDPAVASRSTTLNTFERVHMSGKFVYGFAFGHNSAGYQVDSLSVIDCSVRSNENWTAGDETWWQAGFKSGSGIAGNILNHNYYGCDTIGCRYGLWSHNVNTTWHGGGVGISEADFRQSGPHYLSVDGVRSEGSDRLFQSDGGAGYSANVTLRNILFDATGLHADGRIIKIGYSGPVTLENIEVLSNPVPLRIHFEQGSVPARPVQCTAIGLQTQEPVTSLFSTAGVNAVTSLLVFNYAQVDSSSIIQSRTPLWITGLQGAITTTIDATFDHDGAAVGFYGTTPVAKPSAVTAATALTTLGLATATESWAATAPALVNIPSNAWWGPPFPKTTLALGLSILYGFPVWVPFNRTVAMMAAEITTLAVGSTVTLGIYNDRGDGVPGTLLIDAGTIDGATTGIKSKAISQALTGGRLYHLVALCQGGTPTVRSFTGGMLGNTNTMANAFSGTTPMAGRAVTIGTSTALPATAEGLTNPFAGVPVIAVQFSA